MEDSSENKYNSHAKFLADIAIAILNGNKLVLNVNGVKEIIALYLLIPYITPTTLQTPSNNHVIPHIAGTFVENVKLTDLRDSICHSFVTIEEDKNDGSSHGKYLIFDDRIIQSRKEHDKQGEHSTAYCISKEVVHNRLIELFETIEGM